MLLRYSLSNHYSIWETQELSLVASSLKDREAGLIKCKAAPKGKLLPAAVVYGANASGKTSFVHALRYMRNRVVDSHRSGDPQGGVPRKPFALNSKASDMPSHFDADFMVDDIRYHYGFKTSDAAFVSEWLYSYPTGTKRVLFDREEQVFTFGRTLRGRNKIIADLTRANSLFLSAAAQNDHEELSKISAYFSSIRYVNATSIASGAYGDPDVEEINDQIISFLERIGTGVVGFRKKTEELSGTARELQTEMLAVLKKVYSINSEPEASSTEVTKIELAHKSDTGENIYLDLSDESSGTRRLLKILGPIFHAIENGTLVIVDELDASLHTQVGEAILELFNNPITNPKGAQLIATTHDTNLLACEELRRDQIWFAEKDQHGATHVYPLSDIRTRKGDNIEKGYLEGRYGAVPFSGILPHKMLVS